MLGYGTQGTEGAKVFVVATLGEVGVEKSGFPIWMRDKGLTGIFKESEFHPFLLSSG